MTDTTEDPDVNRDEGREDGREGNHAGASSSAAVAADDDKLVSLCGVTGEWENRKISIMGVVKRFISQLSYGQDLTRIVFPSEFLTPYSILELAADKYLSRFDCLIRANQQAEPAFRMLNVAQFWLSSLYRTKLYKKPYNPVVGESHYCYVEAGGSTTRFIGEQVTHHPPVSAIHIDNEKEQINLQGTISFGVKFHVNSVTIATVGSQIIELQKHNEQYVVSKSIPDLLMKNVVLGTRQMKWQKSTEIVCKNTNCKTVITFQDSGSSEILTGVITQDGNTVLKFEGSLDDEVYYFKPEEDTETLLLSEESLTKSTIIFPPQTDAYPSMKVWKDVTKAIVANDMTSADNAKTLVEEEQRRRTRAGEDELKQRKYFIFNEEKKNWVYKDGSLVMSTS